MSVSRKTVGLTAGGVLLIAAATEPMAYAWGQDHGPQQHYVAPTFALGTSSSSTAAWDACAKRIDAPVMDATYDARPAHERFWPRFDNRGMIPWSGGAALDVALD